MNPADFHDPRAGQVIRTPRGYYAFVPAPLPPALILDAELFVATSRADTALSELAGVGRMLPNPHLLIAPYIRREAVLSSRIEGTRTTLSDLLREEAEEDDAPSTDADVQEVRNYVSALEYGIERLATLPLSLRLVCELHERLMAGVRGERARPGQFRDKQNFIGSHLNTEFHAPFVPPPPAEMHLALHAWERYLHDRGSLPDLIQCALIHEQFEAIHPFLDGNGRLGRLLITLFLIERGRLPEPLLYLSSYIEARRQDYYNLLQRVRTHGDWNSWLHYFLQGVTETARAAAQQARDLMDIREDLRRRLRNRSKAITLIDALFVNPYITVSRAQRVLNTSNPTAREAIRALEDAGVLAEVTQRSWRRVYLARPILEIIEGGSGTGPQGGDTMTAVSTS
jgi:Fic family protein